MRKLRYSLRKPRKKLRRLGATATEYILILVFVVLPIAALMPIFTKMIKAYSQRMTGGLNLPFP